MPVETRMIHGAHVKGFPILGAVRDETRLFCGIPIGVSPDAVRDAFGMDVDLRAVGHSLLAVLPADNRTKAEPAELSLFAGKKSLVAFRNGETAKAACDWLTYHATRHGAEAALIFDRSPPGKGFAQDLDALDPALPVTVVQADSPMGLSGAPDARDPALAPAAPKRDMPSIDPWHAPFGQFVLFELLRRRFLDRAKAVLFLDIPDLLIPDRTGPAFARIIEAAGKVVRCSGIEVYPWRLRQGDPAPHSDHIAHRRHERRRILSWGTVPEALPDTAVWRPQRVIGASALEGAPIPFCRALGVAFPGVPVNRLVRKGDLTEDAALLKVMQGAFDANPIRLPAPATIAPRPEGGSITVVTAMKNEGPFILDWIAHNRVIGIDRHLVYTNDCSDGTETLLDALAEAGVTRRDNPYRALGKVPQHAAFRAAETEGAVDDADWLLTLDVDEYINIHIGEGRLSDLLNAVPEAHAFSMPWRLFGNADQDGFEDIPVTHRFTRAAPAYAPRPLQAWAFKTLYRNAGLFRRLGVHRPKGLVPATQGQIRWVDGSGRDIPSNTWRSCWRMSKSNWGYDLVSLNHYAVRSAESFLVKRDRGRVNHVDRDQGAAYWFRMNHNAEEDTSILRHADPVEKEKARLLALPGVAEAHAASVDWHRRRIATLKAQPDHAALYDLLTSPKLRKLSRIATNFGSNVHYYGPHVIPDEFAERDPTKPFYFTVEQDPRHLNAPV